MKIGVISDTHDNLKSVQKAIKLFAETKVDLIIHCGDWVSPFAVQFFAKEAKNVEIPVKGVLGNNEGDREKIFNWNENNEKPIDLAKDKSLELEVDGKKIAVYHGQDLNILNSLINSGKYNAVFTGHTHKVQNENINNVLVLNPGTTCFAEKLNILDKATIAIYDSSTNSAEIIEFNLNA